jgi:hypothetical protein
MADYLLGRNAVAYYAATLFDVDDDTGAEIKTWCQSATAVGNIMDLSLEVGSDFIDATTRSEASQGFASEIAVLNNGRVTFDARWKIGDTVTDALMDAWLAGDPVAMAFCDQAYNTATTTVTCLNANWSVSVSKTENLRDIQKLSVTLTIASYPLWSNWVNT